MKTCPKCAEEVQDAARVCKHCGHEFGFKLPNIGCGGTIVLACLAIWILSRCTPDTSPPAPATTQYSADRIAECEKLISQAEKAGMIRARSDFNRIDVEDRLWRTLPAESKRGLLLAVGCVAYRHPFKITEYSVAYGYRSGRRLAMATSVGVKFE